jgi:5-methylcytosine-specific restriction endonuclease McrA
MSTYLPAELRQRLLEADDHRCAYCQTTQFNSGYPMVVDHIIPKRKEGSTEFKNLCFACHRCNEFKGSVTEMEDPLTGEMTPLYNPRQQQWHDHFVWDAAGIRIEGLTSIGRVTLIALKMNNEVIVHARQNWVIAGWHPPDP